MTSARDPQREDASVRALRRRTGFTVPVDDGHSAPNLLALIHEAERLGYDTALCGEVAGPEVFGLLGMAAATTERIRLGSGIVAVQTRTPALCAMGFATLASAAPGRIVAGFGASSPIVVGQWHERPFERPLGDTERFVAEYRALMDGERSPGGFRLAMPCAEPPPVWLAAIGPRMLELAGRVADGVFLTWCPPSEVPEKLQSVGPNATDMEVVCSYWGYAGDRPEEALERMRRAVLAYAMVPTHQRAFAQAFAGLDEAAEAWAAGDRKAALAHVTDDAVLALCALGADAVRDRAQAYRDAGVDLPVVLLTGAELRDLDGSMATLAAAV